MYYITAMAVVLQVAAARLSCNIRYSSWEPLVSIKHQLRLDLCLTGAVQE